MNEKYFSKGVYVEETLALIKNSFHEYDHIKASVAVNSEYRDCPITVSIDVPENTEDSRLFWATFLGAYFMLETEF